VVDILDALEPRHPVVVDVMRLVVEDGELRNFPDDFAEIDAALVGLTGRLRTERVEKIITQVVVVERRLAHVPEVDAMDIGQKQVADIALHAYVILHVQRHLEVIAPVAVFVAVPGQDRIVEEDPQPVEVVPQTVEHDDVGGDQQDVAGERGIALVELVKIAPGNL
jgi:hypothetical protein